MSASDNLSTKCSGLLSRSSFAILVARARHLFSEAPMPSDIMHSDISQPPLGPVGRLFSAPGSNLRWQRRFQSISFLANETRPST